MKSMLVGQLAQRTGLTVRTLHHYDEIGLLSPSRRSPAGYRLYGPEDIERLTRILLLRRLNLSLAEIGEILARPESTLERVLSQQLSHLKERIEIEGRLMRRLEALQQRLQHSERISLDQLTRLMEMMTMFDTYYTPEQLEYLKKRAEELGEDTIRRAESEWPQLIARMREEMAKGTDPASQTVQALARRWQELVRQFTGGDAGIEASLRNLYGHESQVRRETGLSPELMEYVARANAADKGET